jgi:succinate-acetate transporter protein
VPPRPHDGEVHPEDVTRVVVRPLGSVLPLGFLAFGVGIFVTAAYSLGWIPPRDGRDVFMFALVFVTPIEAITAVLAYLARDTAGGTTLGVFAGTWATLGTIGIGLAPGETSTTLGIFLLAVGVVILVLAAAAVVGNPAFTVLLAVACARFALNGIFELTGSKPLEHASGYVGLVLAAVAGYGGLAFLLEDARHEPVLPMLRHGAAAQALEADLADSLRRAQREPGVRGRL